MGTLAFCPPTSVYVRVSGGPLSRGGGPINRYEIMCLVRPTAKAEEIDALGQQWAQTVLGAGGEVFKADHWQMRRLAYPIQRFTEGTYILMEFRAPPGIPSELTRQFRLNDNVLRYLILTESKRHTKAREAREAAVAEREAAVAAAAEEEKRSSVASGPPSPDQPPSEAPREGEGSAAEEELPAPLSSVGQEEPQEASAGSDASDEAGEPAEEQPVEAPAASDEV